MNAYKWLVGFFLFFGLAACGTSPMNEDPSNGDNQSSSEQKNTKDNTDAVQSVLDEVTYSVTTEQTNNGIIFEMELTNKLDEDVQFSFSSGKQYEIIARLNGEKVYQYSEGKMFTEALVTETLSSGESLHWNEKWAYQNENIESGTYQVEVSLLPSQVNQQVIQGTPLTKTIEIEI